MLFKLVLFSSVVALSCSYILPESYDENFQFVSQNMELYPGKDDNSGVYYVQVKQQEFSN